MARLGETNQRGIVGKAVKFGAVALIAGLCAMCVKTGERAPNAFEIGPCASTEERCGAGASTSGARPLEGFESDDFSAGVLDGTWSLGGPGGSATLGRAGGEAYVELVVPEGNFDPWQVNHAVRLLQPAADEDFGVEVRFLSTPTARHQMQGILVEQDASNWLRFDTLSDGSKQYVFAAVTLGGSSTQKFRTEIGAGSAPYLQVTRTGDSWEMKYSADGQSWTSAGSFDQALTVSAVGPFAGATTSAPGYTAQVDSFFDMTAPILDEDGTIENAAPVAVNDVATTDAQQVLGMTAPPSSIFGSGDFAGVIDSAWSLEGPGGSADLAVANGEPYLELAVPSGNFDPWGVNRAVRLMHLATDEDFGIEARFLTTPTVAHQMQGILIEQDAENWIRFDTYSNGSRQYVFAAVTVNAISSQKINKLVPNGGAPHLQVERTGDTWELKYSVDGQDWTSAGSFTQAITVSAVGPFAGTTASNDGYTAQVNYFLNTAAAVVEEDAAIAKIAPMAQDDRASVETAQVVAWNGNCDDAAAQPGGIPAHLRPLAATAKTVSGPRGITVDFVPYRLPPHEGNPWSDWGEGLVASNGRFYSAIGDHRGADGDSYLYEYDPATKMLRAVGDVLAAYGAHRPGDWGYGKVHGQISEGPCGQLYFGTYWGTRRGIEYGDSYTGDLLMRYDPVAQQLTSLGVPMPEMGSPSTQMWRAGDLFYGEANHPAGEGGSWPEGKVFWVYDLAKRQVVFRSLKLIDHDSGRDIAVDLEGRAYYSGAGPDLLRYDPATNTQERVASFPRDGKLRASSDPAPDGRIFMTTNQGGEGESYAYLFDPQTVSFRELGPLPGDTADVAISGSGEVAYFTPGSHGQGRGIGFPLMEIDRSGNIRTIVELGPIVDNAGGPYPAGTYSYSTDPANPGDIYILANAGPRGSDKAFGQPLLIVAHLPEAERR